MFSYMDSRCQGETANRINERTTIRVSTTENASLNKTVTKLTSMLSIKIGNNYMRLTFSI